MPSPDSIALDPEAIEMVAQADQQMRAINDQVNGMLGYIIRKAKLEGRWSIAPNRRELVRQPDQSTS